MGYTITIDTDNALDLEKIIVPNDTIIKIEGLPFLLKAGSAIHGLKVNFDTAMKFKEEKPTNNPFHDGVE